MRWVWAAVSLSLTAITIGLSALWFHRMQLPYNEMGRHFDAASAVVYDQGAVLV